MKNLYKISTCIGEEVVTSGGVIDVPTIQTLDHELAGETEVLADTKGFLVNVFC